MSAIQFRTGRAKQETAAAWARRRLADASGRCFTSAGDQDGVLFADSVGSGKTWEALAAAALILYKSRPKSGRRHVLVLCPPNLITKWEGELAQGSPFQHKLDDWCTGIKSTVGQQYAARIRDTLRHVLPIRRGSHVATKLTYGKFRPPGGTYLISHNLIGRAGKGLSAIRREDWDIIIVDEAHNASARKALEAVQRKRRAHTKLLLSATPFQLDPRQWNDLARHIIKIGHKVFSQKAMRTYVEKVKSVFENPRASGPSRAEIVAASQTLSLIAARTLPQKSVRTYYVIQNDGSERDLRYTLDELDDARLHDIFTDLRSTAPASQVLFNQEYLAQRLKLANGNRTTFVATALRRLLARADSPRLFALEAWAEKAWYADLKRSFEVGMPHKTIVFTSWVGALKTGEAAVLRERLAIAFSAALVQFRADVGPKWGKWLDTGHRRLKRLRLDDDNRLASAVASLSRDDLTVALIGAHKGCLKRTRGLLDDHLKAVTTTREELKNSSNRIEARALKRRLNDMVAALDPWSGSALPSVARYTGGDERKSRDRAATGFRQIGPPWVLVASQVGSEGIDLQTYTRRIVHFDLEWNPARMEQREGRGDRVGRLIRNKLLVYYSLVAGTYDERMFHQLVARDRWHGVLLGKPAQALEMVETEAPIVDRKKFRKMRLNLAPR